MDRLYKRHTTIGIPCVRAFDDDVSSRDVVVAKIVKTYLNNTELDTSSLKTYLSELDQNAQRISGRKKRNTHEIGCASALLPKNPHHKGSASS